jgi:murein DD-endopeptidase MepM/ murein hydrolase activator NlpD
MAQAANVRHSPGHANRPPEHVVGAAVRGAAFTITGGPQMADELEWWPVSGMGDGGQSLAGWMALTAPDGRRLLATKATADAIRITRPFAVHVPLTQGWGAWPEYYRDIKYDNVPLKGHNGLDFGTRIGAPVLAVDAGVVIKVDFEVDGFGNHIIIRHAWGESLYAHLESVAVGKDTQVGVGQQVGLAGMTGKCFGEHLHFGIRIFPYRRTDGWGGFVDPTPFMSPGDLIISRASTPALMAPELPGRARP